MFDYVEYKQIEGKITDKNIVVYALSTCGFCKRAMSFLQENDFAFNYIYVDEIAFDLKERIKAELKAKFNTRVSFPYAVIDNASILVGFIEIDWRKSLLGVPHEN